MECFGAHLYIDTKNQRGIALLINVNRGQGCGHVYQLAPAIAKLLSGGIASIPPIDHGNRTSLLQLFGVCLAIGIWLIWSFRRLWKWTKGTWLGLQGWRLWFFLMLPLLLECLLVVALSVSIPVAVSIAFLHSPDAMWLWLLAISLTVVWSLSRTLWIVVLTLNNRKHKGTVFAP